jgi:hypothetical protein
MTVEIKNVRNAQSLSADNLHMDVEIEHPIYGWIPYSITPHDTDTTIDNNLIISLIGNNFLTYVELAQEELDAETAAQVRSDREYKLFTEVDPLVSNFLRWADISSEKQTEWTQYRIDLLDVPQQSGFPNNIIWPNKPE